MVFIYLLACPFILLGTFGPLVSMTGTLILDYQPFQAYSPRRRHRRLLILLPNCLRPSHHTCHSAAPESPLQTLAHLPRDILHLQYFFGFERNSK